MTGGATDPVEGGGAGLAAMRHRIINETALIHGFVTHVLENLGDLDQDEIRRWLERVSDHAAALTDAAASWLDPSSVPPNLPGTPASAQPSLPRRPAARPPSHPGWRPRADAARPGRLLLVEDNDDHVLLVQSLLTTSSRGAAWEVVRAASLAEARRLVVETDPSCCLVDLTLPDADGLEAVETLRALAPHRPIVVVTGNADANVGTDAMRRGAQDYLIKGQLVGEALERSIVYAIERMALEQELASRALHDPLTGLPNRSLLLDRLEHALVRLRRRPGLVAVIFLDLDRFKLVNDRLGHHAGDEILQGVAQRVRGAVRANDTVARLGGDEFVILCEDLNEASEAGRLADHLLERFDEPLACSRGAQRVTASMGVAVTSGGDEESPDKLLARADSAMYVAKDRGRARWEMARAVAGRQG